MATLGESENPRNRLIIKLQIFTEVKKQIRGQSKKNRPRSRSTMSTTSRFFSNPTELLNEFREGLLRRWADFPGFKIEVWRFK